MEITSGPMPQNVKKYVAMGTKFVNLVLLACNIGYGILFWVYDAPVLFYYSCVSILFFIFACVMLEKKRKWIYTITVFLQIFLFMILAVVYLGWDYGFQHYCIGFVASLIFTDFYMSHERRVTRTTMAIVGFNVLLYVALRLWTYEHPYIYQIDNEILVKVFYLFNSLIGFAFLIMYLLIYSSTVHRLENSLMEMASVDPLTGLSNRRRMQEMLQSALDEYETQRHQNVIAMLDVDFFKKINDTYGHDAGDEVLKVLARILRDKHEENVGFHICRWGGEEFLIFYERHQKSRENVIQEFDMLRRQIQDTVIQYNGFDIKITATIGLAFYEKGKAINSLIKEADNNLYAGKTAGRNRVVS